MANKDIPVQPKVIKRDRNCNDLRLLLKTMFHKVMSSVLRHLFHVILGRLHFLLAPF